MANKILPVPFAESLYGTTSANIYKQILNIQGANPNCSSHVASNLIRENCTILSPLEYQSFPDNRPEKGSFFESNLSMAKNLSARIVKDFDINSDRICLIGGDHSISIGTGAGLSKITDMSRIGLIWVDAHGDFNTDQTSLSKSITGYPCAINTGLGLEDFTNLFNNNFVQKVVQIGIRDIDVLEKQNLVEKKVKTYSTIQIEDLGMSQVMWQALDYLSDCDYIWLSMDVDSLDSVYFLAGETDEPTFGGLTPRELIYITSKVQKTNKLKVFEFTQLNDVGANTNLLVLASRLIEASFGLGGYRYNH